MKKIEWLGNVKKVVKSFPVEVRQEVGFTLFLAQKGEKAVHAVPLVGFGGAHVLEVVIDDDGNAYRAVYTVKFGDVIYALHAFQKKAKRGVATPLMDMRLIRRRLKMAEAHYAKHYAPVKKRDAAG